RKLIRARRGAGDDVRNAAAVREQFALLGGFQQALGETAAVQGGPESVAGPREVVPAPRRVQPGGDAAEEDAQVICNDVRHPAVSRGEEVGAGGAGDAHLRVVRVLHRKAVPGSSPGSPRSGAPWVLCGVI